jgi:DNA repair protein RadC
VVRPAGSGLVHPREVFRAAILDGAGAIILAHNHPSGDPTPSSEDIRITRQLVEAGKILDIEVLDHVVVGRGERPFLSLRESGLVSFGK